MFRKRASLRWRSPSGCPTARSTTRSPDVPSGGPMAKGGGSRSWRAISRSPRQCFSPGGRFPASLSRLSFSCRSCILGTKTSRRRSLTASCRWWRMAVSQSSSRPPVIPKRWSGCLPRWCRGMRRWSRCSSGDRWRCYGSGQLSVRSSPTRRAGRAMTGRQERTWLSSPCCSRSLPR